MTAVDMTRMHVPAGRGADGEILSFAGLGHVWKITSEMSRGAFVVFQQVLPPDGGVPLHIHHSDEENILLIEGALDFQLDQEMFKVNPGDMVNMPRGIVHGFRNTSDRPAQVLFTVDLSPDSNYERMFKDLSELAPGDEAGMLRVSMENNVEFITPITLPRIAAAL